MSQVEQLTEEYKTRILSLKDMLAKKDITETEYNELVEDILDLDKFQHKINNEAMKVQAAKAIQALSMLAKII